MTTTTATRTAGALSTAAPSRAYRLTAPHVLRAEWIKFRSLRSTVWTLAITVLLMVGMAVMFAAIMRSLIGDTDLGGAGDLMPGAMIVVMGYSFAQLVVAVLGALTITGEYTTGMIRSTFSAVPTRFPALAAKAVVLAVVTFVVSAVGVALSYLATLPILSGTVLEVDLGADGVLRSFVGTPLYLSAIAVLALAFGVLLRSSAGTIFSLVALLYVVPGILSFIPVDWVRDAAQFLPSAAGDRLVIGDAMGSGILSPWQGFAVVVAWVAVTFVAATVVVKRRDA